MDDFMSDLAHDLARDAVAIGAVVFGAVAILVACTGWAIRRRDRRP